MWEVAKSLFCAVWINRTKNLALRDAFKRERDKEKRFCMRLPQGNRTREAVLPLTTVFSLLLSQVGSYSFDKSRFSRSVRSWQYLLNPLRLKKSLFWYWFFFFPPKSTKRDLASAAQAGDTNLLRRCLPSINLCVKVIMTSVHTGALFFRWLFVFCRTQTVLWVFKYLTTECADR